MTSRWYKSNQKPVFRVDSVMFNFFTRKMRNLTSKLINRALGSRSLIAHSVVRYQLKPAIKMLWLGVEVWWLFPPFFFARTPNLYDWYVCVCIYDCVIVYMVVTCVIVCVCVCVCVRACVSIRYQKYVVCVCYMCVYDVCSFLCILTCVC